MEEPKYSDCEQQDKDDKTYNFRSTSTRAKIEIKKRGKEDNINSELAQEENSDISNRDVCPLCNRPVKTGVECGICSRWFHYKCEGTTEERVLNNTQISDANNCTNFIGRFSACFHAEDFQIYVLEQLLHLS